MSASEAMRASVRGLMAEARTSITEKTDSDANIADLCYAYAVDACPAELLYGTKFSVGKCKWIHEEFLKNSIPMREVGRVEIRALRVIESALNKLDRLEQRNRRGFDYRANIELVKEEHDDLLKEREIRYVEEIDALLAIARRFGEQEHVEEALRVMEKVNLKQTRLKAVAAKIKRRQQAGNRGPSQSILMVNVCDQCGIAFGLDSKAMRLQAHREGKLHKSICILRDTAEDLRAKYSMSVRSRYEDELSPRGSSLSLVSTLREDYDRDFGDF